ncbi:MAG: OstA-like protein [Balneolaceae bacterium]
MKRVVCKSLLLMVLLLIASAGWADLQAQRQVTILNANQYEEEVIEGEIVRRLYGEVEIQTDRMLMIADSAYHFAGRNLIHAFNIQIETDDELIWADTLYYDTQIDYSRLRGRVIIETENNRLFSEEIDYDQIFNVVLFHSPVRFEDEDGTLLAETGYYFRETDIAFFRNDVQLSDPTRYMEADSLFMNRSEDFYQLFDNVYAANHEERVTFTGEYLEADSSGYRLLDGDAWMMKVNESGRDTTHLDAATILVQEQDSVSTIDAYRNVRIWSPSFSAIADTLHYRDDTEEFRLLSGPIAWQNRIQLTGPYIRALLEDEEIRFLESYTRPIIVMEDSVTGRLNQMTGDTLRAWFDQGEIERIRVFDNSEVIFHRKNENEEPDGLMEMMATGPSSLTFFEGEPDEFIAHRNPDGSYLPEHPDNIDRRLPGFQWNPEQRPQQPSVRQPNMPAITTEPLFEFPPRYRAWLREQEENGTSTQ